MPSSKKTKIISHGTTSKPPKKVTKNNAAEKAVELADKAQVEYWQAFLEEKRVDNDPGIDVPLHARGGQWKWNFENKMPLHDKITWVLTAVNVAILSYLIIKNV